MFSLFLVSILLVACGQTATTNTQVAGNPIVTITINPNQTFASPTPAQPSYTCGAWVTNTSPAYSKNAVVPVYAYYKHLQDGNPFGMDGARAEATVLWPNGSPETFDATTTSDGLAVFMVNMQESAINHVVLISVAFTSSDGLHTCNITGTQDAFFTVIAVSPTPRPKQPTPPTPTQTPVVPLPTAPGANPPPFPGQTPTAIGVGPGN